MPTLMLIRFTSEGIFVHDDDFGVDVVAGDIVRVQGTVDEYYDLTEIAVVDHVIVCSSGASVTPAEMTLPVQIWQSGSTLRGCWCTCPKSFCHRKL